MKQNKKVVLAVFITFVSTLIVTSFVFVFADIPYVTGGKVGRAISIVESAFYEDVDRDTLYEGALSGMMAALDDEYSWYVNESNYQKLTEDMEGAYTGIGVVVSVNTEDNLIEIVSPIEGTPAQRANLNTGDKILAIDGTSVSADNYQEAVNMIRGSGNGPGTPIVLTILKNGETTPQDITLISETIVQKTVKSKMLTNQVGYIRITSFDEPTSDEFASALDELGRDSLNGLVIDLRSNPGGTLSSLEEIADMLIPQGVIIQFQYRNGKVEKIESDDSYLDIPISVIINGGSASASEALAGCLRDHGRATLVGEKSYGKGVMQTVIPFSHSEKGSTALYLTTAKYLTPSGECIHKIGITPDIEVPTPQEWAGKSLDDLTLLEDIQLQAALDAVLGQVQ